MNNLQFLHRKKNQHLLKLRKRKFKLKILNKNTVRSYNSAIPNFRKLFGLRVKHACRLKFNALIGAEKALAVTKNRVWIKYKRYPDFYVTKKSSKSRMGKGKGKIAGRVLRVKKNEVIFNFYPANPLKTKKWIKKLKETIPSKSRVVISSSNVGRFYDNYYRNLPWMSFRRKRKKSKKRMMMKKKKIVIPEYKRLHKSRLGRANFGDNYGFVSFFHFYPERLTQLKKINKFRMMIRQSKHDAYTKHILYLRYYVAYKRTFGTPNYLGGSVLRYNLYSPRLTVRNVRRKNFSDLNKLLPATNGKFSENLIKWYRYARVEVADSLINPYYRDSDGFTGVARYLNFMSKFRRGRERSLKKN